MEPHSGFLDSCLSRFRLAGFRMDAGGSSGGLMAHGHGFRGNSTPDSILSATFGPFGCFSFTRVNVQRKGNGNLQKLAYRRPASFTAVSRATTAACVSSVWRWTASSPRNYSPAQDTHMERSPRYLHLETVVHVRESKLLPPRQRGPVRPRLRASTASYCSWIGSTSTCQLQRGFTARVPQLRLIRVRVVVRLHLNFDLGHGAGHPSARGHSRGGRARDLQVEGDAEEGQAAVTTQGRSQ